MGQPTAFCLRANIQEGKPSTVYDYLNYPYQQNMQQQKNNKIETHHDHNLTLFILYTNISVSSFQVCLPRVGQK